MRQALVTDEPSLPEPATDKKDEGEE